MNFQRSEAAPGAIPLVQNVPQKLKYGLYSERISGTSFTVPRKDVKQTWLYRIVPSTCHDEYEELPDHPLNINYQATSGLKYKPASARWAPVKIEKEKDFLTGLHQIGGAGEPSMKSGVAYYSFTAGKSMPENQAFYTADGDFLIGML